MKKNKILSGVVALSALVATAASAQSFNNGDLYAIFNKNLSPDVIIDLGALNTYQNMSLAPYTVSGVSTELNSVYGGVTGVNWTIFGFNNTAVSPNNSSVTQTDPNSIWLTLPQPGASRVTSPAVGNSDSQNLLVIDFSGLVNNYIGLPGSVSPSSSILEIASGQGAFGTSMGNDNNWNGDYAHNVVNHAAGTADLFQADPGSSGHASYMGAFSLDAGGGLTFNAVPEPSTLAMIGLGSVCLLGLARKKNLATK